MSPQASQGFPDGVSCRHSGWNEPFSRSQELPLAGKRALITGAGIGIGRGIALELAREGADVGIHYYNERALAEETVESIVRAGGKAEAFSADLGAPDGLDQVFTWAEHALGGIDILVNNSGITANMPFSEVGPAFFDRLMNVNVRAMYFLTQRAAELMKRQGGGTIINLCSLHANFAMNEHSVYAMTKAAVQAFTRNVALELAPFKIRVNAITPGWCFGETHLKVLGSESRAEDASRIPAGYIAAPAAIGRLAVQLCVSDLDLFVGQTLVFDGGQSAIMPNTGQFDAPAGIRWGTPYLGS